MMKEKRGIVNINSSDLSISASIPGNLFGSYLSELSQSIEITEKPLILAKFFTEARFYTESENNNLGYIMKKHYLLLLLASAALLQGCSAFDKHHGVNWGEGTCPPPTADAIGKSNQLIIEDGKTLKCQIRPYVSNMACQGITDKTNADGVVCQNGLGQSILFIFDDKGVLKKHGSV